VLARLGFGRFIGEDDALTALDGVEEILPTGGRESAGVRFHFGAGLLGLREERSVFDGDGELAGQRLEGRKVVGAEGAGFVALHIEHAHHSFADEERHGHFRLGERQEGVGAEGGAGGDVGDEDGSFFGGGRAVDGAGTNGEFKSAQAQLLPHRPGAGVQDEGALRRVGEIDLCVIHYRTVLNDG